MKERSGAAARHNGSSTAHEQFGALIEEIERILKDTKDLSTNRGKLLAKRAELDVLDAKIRAEFDETERHLRNAALPQEILERHRKFVEHYTSHFGELLGYLQAMEGKTGKEGALLAEQEVVAAKAIAFIEQTKPPKRHIPLDPHRLPHRSPKPTTKEPRTRPEEFRSVLRGHGWDGAERNPVLLASREPLQGILSTASDLTAISGEPHPASLRTPLESSLPTTEDLAESIEVQFTPEIRAKAQELGHDPVRIYNWVRNTIEFVPTYGSIQGAPMTLETLQGNAFDTASLLIALLRASNIPARYVLGTIEVPIAKVMNWVGGFTEPRAALEFMASGGIPVKGLIAGGELTAAQFEHVWVEAYIDYLPSRGSRHRQGDTWIPLDASFKQYTYTQGVDLLAAVPFDAQSFIDQITASATINETESFVTSVDSSLVQQTIQDYQARVQQYLTEYRPHETVNEIFGGQTIIKEQFPYLCGTLAYKQLVKGMSFSAIPVPLRHRVTFSIGMDTTLARSLPELAGQKITLSFSPATERDELALNAYLPKPHTDGSPIQSDEFPSSLPAYLIHVKPELRVAGKLVAVGKVLGLGTGIPFVMSLYDPSIGENSITNTIDAGVFAAISLNAGDIPLEQVLAIKSKLEVARAILETGVCASLTKENILGDLLYANAVAYHAEVGVANTIMAKKASVKMATLPSEAMFLSQLRTSYFWGVPRSVTFGGLAMDADLMRCAATAIDGNKDKYLGFMQTSGMTASALEHSVPEQVFSTLDHPAEGISAVKALKMANDQSIPVYRISQSNAETILPQLLIDPETKWDIESAVNAGKVVTVSERNISLNGWTGCGYIIFDPDTGAGAYMISGGLNGGYIMVFVGFLLIIIGLMTVEFGPALALVLLGIVYLGQGLCIIYESDIPLQIAWSTFALIISLVFGEAMGINNMLVSLGGFLFGVLCTLSGDDMKKFCKNN